MVAGTKIDPIEQVSWLPEAAAEPIPRLRPEIHIRVESEPGFVSGWCVERVEWCVKAAILREFQTSVPLFLCVSKVFRSRVITAISSGLRLVMLYQRGEVLSRSDDLVLTRVPPRQQALFSPYPPHDTPSRAVAVVGLEVKQDCVARRRGIGSAAAYGSHNNRSGRMWKPVIDTIGR